MAIIASAVGIEQITTPKSTLLIEIMIKMPLF
jgi:hypothetical protein